MLRLTCLFVVIFCVMSEAAARSKLRRSNPELLPEENFRERWDKGCSDWRDLFVGKSAKENLSIQFERSGEQYTLWGQARLSPEPGETPEQLLKSLEKLLSNYSEYKDWIFPGVNEHPVKGSRYFVVLNDLNIEARQAHHILLTGPFDFQILSLKVAGHSTIELKWKPDSRLHCADAQSAIWRYRMYPRPDILEWMIGELVLFRRGDRFVDIQTRFVMRPSPLVYSLLPAKLIEHELRYRAQRVFRNVIELRRSKVWASGKPSPSELPSKPKVQSPKKGS